MSLCNLTIENFDRPIFMMVNGPILDQNGRCRACGKLPKEHPAAGAAVPPTTNIFSNSSSISNSRDSELSYDEGQRSEMPWTVTLPFLEMHDPNKDDCDDVNLIGRGAFGRVYRMKNTITGSMKAVKTIRFKKDKRPERVFEEAKILESFNHPNIVRFFSFAFDQSSMTDSTFFYLIMEYIDGVSLQYLISHPNQLVDQQPLSTIEDYFISWMHQILNALSYLHNQGIVHRDIKPSNIMIVQRTTVKLIDFGLTITEPPSASASDPTRVSFAGTTRFMSPEKSTGQTYDDRDDIWAFACVILELIFSCSCYILSKQNRLHHNIPSLNDIESWISTERIPYFQHTHEHFPIITNILPSMFIVKSTSRPHAKDIIQQYRCLHVLSEQILLDIMYYLDIPTIPFFEADILRYARLCIPKSRRWLHDDVDNWLSEPRDDSNSLKSSLYTVYADAGMGKSTFISSMISKHKKRLIGVSYISSTSTAISIIKGLAFQIAYYYSSCRRNILLNAMIIHEQKISSIKQIYENLLMLPLSEYKPDVDQPCMICLDGLDMLADDQLDDLINVILDLTKSNPYIRIIISSRPYHNIISLLSHAQSRYIHSNDPHHIKDMRMLLESSFHYQFDMVSDKILVMDDMMDYAEGRIIYLVKLLESISTTNSVSYTYSSFMMYLHDDIIKNKLQSSMNSYYDTLWLQHTDSMNDSDIVHQPFTKLLRNMSVARLPLPISDLSYLLQSSYSELYHTIDSLRGIIIIINNGSQVDDNVDITYYHSTMQHYFSHMVDKSNNQLIYDPIVAHEYMVTSFDAIITSPSYDKQPSFYIVKNFLYHVKASGRHIIDYLLSLHHLWLILYHGNIQILLDGINIINIDLLLSNNDASSLLRKLHDIFHIWKILMESLRSTRKLSIQHFLFDLLGRISFRNEHKNMKLVSDGKQYWSKNIPGRFYPIHISYHHHWNQHLYTPFMFDKQIDAIVWTPTGNLLVACHGHVRSYDGQNLLSIIYDEIFHTCCITAMICYPDGKIVSAAEDGSIRISYHDAGLPLRNFHAHNDSIECIGLLHDGRIVSGSSDERVCIWDPDFCSLSLEHRYHEVVTSLLVLSEGINIIIGLDDGSVYQWDVITDERMIKYAPGHTTTVISIVMIANNHIASGSADKSIMTWDTITHTCMREISLGLPITCLLFDPKESILVAACQDSKLYQISYHDGHSEHDMPAAFPIESSGYVTGMVRSYMNGTSSILASMTDKTIRICNFPISPMTIHPITHLLLFDSGRCVVSITEHSIQLIYPNKDVEVDILVDCGGKLITHAAKCIDNYFVTFEIEPDTGNSSIQIWEVDHFQMNCNLRQILSPGDELPWVLQYVSIMDYGTMIACYDDESKKILLWKLQPYNNESIVSLWQEYPISTSNDYFNVDGSESILCMNSISEYNIIAGTNFGHVIIWDITSHSKTIVCSLHNCQIVCLSYTSDHHVIICTGEVAIWIFDTDQDKTPKLIYESLLIPQKLTCSPDHKNLAILFTDGSYGLIPLSIEMGMNMKFKPISSGEWLVYKSSLSGIAIEDIMMMVEEINLIQEMLYDIGHSITCVHLGIDYLVYGTSMGHVFYFGLRSEYNSDSNTMD